MERGGALVRQMSEPLAFSALHCGKDLEIWFQAADGVQKSHEPDSQCLHIAGYTEGNDHQSLFVGHSIGLGGEPVLDMGQGREVGISKMNIFKYLSAVSEVVKVNCTQTATDEIGPMCVLE